MTRQPLFWMIVAVFAFAAWFASRLPQQQYRTAGTDVCVVSTDQGCDTSAMLVDRAGDVYLGFLEFDDQGDLWDRATAEELFSNVGAVAEQSPVTIVVFAHGWNHGARAGDSDVENFRELLGALHDTEAEFAGAAGRRPERKVVGIYLGWPGKTLKGPLHYLTFWSRKDAAHRVGSRGAFEVLKRLSVIRHRGERADRNRLVLVGHSFGGALISSAMLQTLSASLEDMAAGVPDRFADLVVILNAAIEAQRFASLVHRSRELETRLENQMPVFLSVTSTGDLATKIAFPGGRWFATLFQPHRSQTAPDNHPDAGFNQRRADRRSIGHYRPFTTHALAPCVVESGLDALETCPDVEASDAPVPVDAQYMSAFRTTARRWHSERETPRWYLEFPSSVLYHVAGPARGPVMNVAAQKSLVIGHNGIWGSALMLFVRDLIAMNYVADRPESIPAGGK